MNIPKVIISGVSVTFRCGGVFFGKAIVIFRTDGMEVTSRSFDQSAIRIMFGIGPAAASLVVRDLTTRALRVAGHFIALGGRYPFSLDPDTRIEANIVWLDPQLLPK